VWVGRDKRGSENRGVLGCRMAVVGPVRCGREWGRLVCQGTPGVEGDRLGCGRRRRSTAIGGG